MVRIYYADGTVSICRSRADWQRSPDDSVQVVVEMVPAKEGDPAGGWTYEVDGHPVSVDDRRLWTGQDRYNPLGWGVKTGSLMETDAYFGIWRRACGDD